MKYPLSVALGLLGLALVSGCESMSGAADSVRARLAGRDEAKVRTYAGTPRRTYEAVRTAAAEMGFKFLRGGAAQGTFEAVSSRLPGADIGSSRQITMKVSLKATLDEKGTDVTARLGEVIESDSSNRAGQATEAPLRDTPLYEVFFRNIQLALDGPRRE